MDTVVVTGANRGIGLELCRQLVARGERVIGVCRDSSGELDALGIRVEDGVDVTVPGQVTGLARRLEGVRIGVLVLNAGVLLRGGLADLDEDGFEDVRTQLEINAVAPLRMAVALLGNLGSGSKVAIITSRMGSIADNTSGGYYGYRMSKAAVNMAGVSLAHDLRPRGVAVAILHPGMVATRMTGGAGIPPEESARGLIARIDALTLRTSGTFWHQNGEILPW